MPETGLHGSQIVLRSLIGPPSPAVVGDRVREPHVGALPQREGLKLPWDILHLQSPVQFLNRRLPRRTEQTDIAAVFSIPCHLHRSPEARNFQRSAPHRHHQRLRAFPLVQGAEHPSEPLFRLRKRNVHSFIRRHPEYKIASLHRGIERESDPELLHLLRAVGGKTHTPLQFPRSAHLNRGFHPELRAAGQTADSAKGIRRSCPVGLFHAVRGNRLQNHHILFSPDKRKDLPTSVLGNLHLLPGSEERPLGQPPIRSTSLPTAERSTANIFSSGNNLLPLCDLVA